MKTNFYACLATLLCVATAQGQVQPYVPYDGSSQPYAGHPMSDIGYCDCGEAVCGCEPTTSMPQCGCASAPMCGCESAPPCDYDNGHIGFEATCGTELVCEPGCDDMVNCSSGGCDGCGSNSCMGNCPLAGLMSCSGGDEPFSLFGSCGNFTMGGWVQLGYHDENNTLVQ